MVLANEPCSPICNVPSSWKVSALCWLSSCLQLILQVSYRFGSLLWPKTLLAQPAHSAVYLKSFILSPEQDLHLEPCSLICNVPSSWKVSALCWLSSSLQLILPYRSGSFLWPKTLLSQAVYSAVYLISVVLSQEQVLYSDHSTR